MVICCGDTGDDGGDEKVARSGDEKVGGEKGRPSQVGWPSQEGIRGFICGPQREKRIATPRRSRDLLRERRIMCASLCHQYHPPHIPQRATRTVTAAATPGGRPKKNQC